MTVSTDDQHVHLSTRPASLQPFAGSTAPASQALYIVPNRRGDGFHASIRGHLLELADPTNPHLAPVPDDLLVVSIASDLAWHARRFLQGHGLADDLSVEATWRTPDDPPRPVDITVTVTVLETAEAMSDSLVAALEERVAARSLDDSLRFSLRCEG